MSLSGAGAIGVKMFGWAAIVAAVGAVLSAAVVMCISRPKTEREWFVAITTTAISSICGGAWIIMHLGLQFWVFDPIGLVAMLGLVFLCGLPGWFVVRVSFNYMKKHSKDDIVEIGKDIKDTFL